MQREHPARQRGHASSDLSHLPSDDQLPMRKAPARRRAKAAPAAHAGPGGLGYVLALHEKEQSKIAWHGDEAAAPVPPEDGHH